MQDYLLYYNFLYALLVGLFSFLLSRRLEKKVWLYMGLVLMGLLLVATLTFVLGNFSKSVAYSQYNFFGLRINLWVTAVITLASVITWVVIARIKKERTVLFPALFVLSLIELLACWLLMFFYTKSVT